jgi:hypothetical protein
MPIQRATNYSRPQIKAPRQKLNYEVPSFGTIDTTTDPTLIREIDSPDNLNIVYSSFEAVGSRNGYTKLLTTAAPSFIGGMYPFYKSDGTKKLLFASGANLRTYDNAGGSTVVTGTPTTFTPNLQWSFDEYNDVAYGGNGTDPLIGFNGSNYNITNSAITPQFVKVNKNRLYCVNKSSSTLYFSDAGNPNSFPINNFIQINTNDGQNITGIEVINDNVVIFKDDSVWILAGDPLGSGNTTTIGNLQLRKANSSVGCSAFRTIQKVGSVLYFMHYTGIYALQNYSVVSISDYLSNTFGKMNQNFINLCWALYDDFSDQYIMGYPSSTSVVCDSAIILNTTTKGYSLWDHIPGAMAIKYKFSSLQPNLVMGDPSKGNIYTLLSGYADIAGDNGTATSGSTTTLVDTTKTWTTNIFVDCRIKFTGGAGSGLIAIVLSNTSNTITFTTTLTTAPGTGTTYSIGYYDSYWKSKPFDFHMTGYSKKYRFLNVFIDSEIYNILFGISVDFQPLTYQKPLKLASGALVWGQAGITWGLPGYTWGSYSSQFVQANIGSTGRYIQIMLGNNLANQPWRIFKYSIGYKLKKMRPNIQST